MRTITSSLTRVSAALAVGLGLAAGAYAQHPQSQPKPVLEDIVVTPIPDGWRVETVEGMFPPGNNETNPPGTNFLTTVYENYRLPDGTELPNTLPSTPDGKYNLHDGPVSVKSIRRESPIEDMLTQIVEIERHANHANLPGAEAEKLGKLKKAIWNALDILEGNKLDKQYLPDRAYEGMPLLHYNGPLKNKVVQPIFDPNTGQKIGGNVEVNMVYYGEFIESDTAMIDPSQVLDVPFTITYHVNILQNGIEDFSPFVMYFDSAAELDEFLPVRARNAGVAMDQTFFPMLKEGTRYTVKIKQAPGSHWSLIYHWGWRIHPPRVQVLENATKRFPINSQLQPIPITLLQMEQEVFGVNPRQNKAAMEAAIAKIGDLAPPKRMWNILQQLDPIATGGGFTNADAAMVGLLAAELREAYLQWLTRRKLPSGVTADPNSDVTLLYVNNTIYGEMPQKVIGQGSGLGPEIDKSANSFSLFDWNTRPFEFKATLLNGDHFYHAYVNVDFGGWRGWENHFQFTDPTTLIDEDTGEPLFPIDRGGTDEHLEASPRNPDINGDPQLGSGCFFTFGRVHFWVNAGPPVGAPTFVAPVQANGTPTRMNIEVQMNFEPTMRLKVYQFDPFHHDVAVFSLH
jgi:hypothetical protein